MALGEGQMRLHFALALVFWYSLAKRYTTWTQMFLGLAMAAYLVYTEQALN